MEYTGADKNDFITAGGQQDQHVLAAAVQLRREQHGGAAREGLRLQRAVDGVGRRPCHEVHVAARRVRHHREATGPLRRREGGLGGGEPGLGGLAAAEAADGEQVAGG